MILEEVKIILPEFPNALSETFNESFLSALELPKPKNNTLDSLSASSLMSRVDGIDSYFIIGVTCNPYLYAIHNWIALNKYLSINYDFPSFLRLDSVYQDIKYKSDDHLVRRFFMQQHEFYYSDTKLSLLNYSFKIENSFDSQEFLNKVLNFKNPLNLSFENLYYDLSDFYISDNLWNLCKKRYHDDFEMLGYST